MSTEERPYPQPISVITATILAYDIENPMRIVTVELQSGEEGIIVLPGGIFDHHRHRDPLETGVFELTEETGLVATSEPVHFGMDLRKDRDRREFRGMKTDHCCDFLLSVPVSGDFKPVDVEEVRKVGWTDTREIDPKKVGRGHYETIRLWLAWMSNPDKNLVYLRGN